MDVTVWDRLTLPGASGPDDGALWELMHENSKTTRWTPPISDQAVAERMAAMCASFAPHGVPPIALPEGGSRLTPGLGAALAARRSTRAFSETPLALGDLACLLGAAYGISAPEGANQPRPFRTVPSGGGLFPLELYVAARHVEGLTPAIYHFAPEDQRLRRHGSEAQLAALDRAFVQPEVIAGAGAVVLFAAAFERHTFKYGDRGYRFTLIEAGHAAQNLCLAVADLGLGAVCLGGYYDHEVDDLLRLDGVTASVVYAVAVGGLQP